MTRQLINLIGGLVALLVLVGGAFLVAVPMYAAAESVGNEADQAASANDTQQLVIDGLRAQEAKFDELQADLAALRAQVASESRVDDLVALALSATAANGGSLDGVQASPAEPFAVRVGEETAPAATAPPADAETTDAETTGAEQTTTEAVPAPTGADDTQAQVPVTLTITAPDVSAATSIVDALRAGPRVVAITQADTVTDSGEGGLVTLTVNALLFVNRG